MKKKEEKERKKGKKGKGIIHIINPYHYFYFKINILVMYICLIFKKKLYILCILQHSATQVLNILFRQYGQFNGIV